MTTQQVAFTAWLILSLCTVATFTIIGLRSRRQITTDSRTVNRFRLLMLALLLVLSVAFLGYTLPKVPYPIGRAVPDEVIFVTGKQFSFGISKEPITTEAEWEKVTQFGGVVQVPRDALVEFRVTSLDVNHGFSLYDPDGVLLGQVQAMPGYVNRLRYRFTKPGNYTALCMEYCGNSHHTMRGRFIVK